MSFWSFENWTEHPFRKIESSWTAWTGNLGLIQISQSVHVNEIAVLRSIVYYQFSLFLHLGGKSMEKHWLIRSNTWLIERYLHSGHQYWTTSDWPGGAVGYQTAPQYCIQLASKDLIWLNKKGAIESYQDALIFKISRYWMLSWGRCITLYCTG